MIPSQYQEDIFKFVQSGTGHAVVEAVAGSGKTTTIRKSLDLIDHHKRVLLVAFNKHIADELASKIPMGFEARTCHSIGFEILKQSYGFVKVNNDKVRNILKFDLKCDWKFIKPITRLISLMKSCAYRKWDNWQALADNHDIEFPKDFDPTFGEKAFDFFKRGVCDFDDMIWRPVVENLNFPEYDYVFVDEAQDLSPIQVEFVERLLKDTGRIIFVGDSRQAIYGFRGADTEAMERIAQRFNVSKLPLSICYRCAKNVVKRAQDLVPHIECADTQEDGTVTDVKEMVLQDGDYVLCRVTADLVSECMEQIRNGRKAMVKGRDIGDGLIGLIKQLCKEGDTVETLKEKLFAWQSTQDSDNEAKMVAVEDKVNTISALCGGLKNVSEVIQRIETLFSDSTSGIVFSTIHKAKGLEADNVYILRPDLLPHPRCKKEWQRNQEDNLKYVAITRAKKNLYFVERN